MGTGLGTGVTKTDKVTQSWHLEVGVRETDAKQLSEIVSKGGEGNRKQSWVAREGRDGWCCPRQGDRRASLRRWHWAEA
jgi:hypothetical protein